MNRSPSGYLPALRWDWLTPFYDPLLRWTLRERVFKRRLVTQARIEPGQTVLDLGCGTGTLTLLVRVEHPGVRVIGGDGDPRVLRIAKRKAAEARVAVTFERSVAHELPHGDGSFDRVLSSLLMHHLTLDEKRRALSEVHRILKPGGELHIADWGEPDNFTMRVASLTVRLLDGFERTRDNVAGQLPKLLAEAGFERIRESTQYRTVFGTLSLLAARRPSGSSDSEERLARTSARIKRRRAKI